MFAKITRMSDSTYDFLKSTVELGLPAIGAFYFTLSQIWGFPKGEEVVGTVAAITVLCGVFLALSRKNYNAELDDFDV